MKYKYYDPKEKKVNNLVSRKMSYNRKKTKEKNSIQKKNKFDKIALEIRQLSLVQLTIDILEYQVI